jgi:hypothetical protein
MLKFNRFSVPDQVGINPTKATYCFILNPCSVCMILQNGTFKLW